MDILDNESSEDLDISHDSKTSHHKGSEEEVKQKERRDSGGGSVSCPAPGHRFVRSVSANDKPSSKFSSDSLEELSDKDVVEERALDANVIKAFTIPKKKKTNKDFFEDVSLTSREFTQDIQGILSRTYKDPATDSRFKYTKAQMIHNSTIENAYLEKRKTLRSNGYSEKETTESYGFLYVPEMHKARQICKNGLKKGHSKLGVLGHPDMGVYLSRHADILRPVNVATDYKGIVIIFKVIKGKVKSVTETTSSTYIEPTPNFDCHISKTPVDLSSMTLKKSFESAQMYLYEYNEDLELEDFPRNICPYALLEFSFTADKTQKTTQPSPQKQTSPSKSRSTTGRKSGGGHCRIWTGEVGLKAGAVCKADLLSYSSTNKPAHIGGEITLSMQISYDAIEQEFLTGVKTIKKDSPLVGVGGLTLTYCMLVPVRQYEGKFEKIMNTIKKSDKGFLVTLQQHRLVVMATGELSKRLGLPGDKELALHCIFISRSPKSGQLRNADTVEPRHKNDEKFDDFSFTPPSLGETPFMMQKRPLLSISKVFGIQDYVHVKESPHGDIDLRDCDFELETGTAGLVDRGETFCSETVESSSASDSLSFHGPPKLTRTVLEDPYDTGYISYLPDNSFVSTERAQEMILAQSAMQKKRNIAIAKGTYTKSSRPEPPSSELCNESSPSAGNNQSNNALSVVSLSLDSIDYSLIKPILARVSADGYRTSPVLSPSSTVSQASNLAGYNGGYDCEDRDTSNSNTYLNDDWLPAKSGRNRTSCSSDYRLPANHGACDGDIASPTDYSRDIDERLPVHFTSRDVDERLPVIYTNYKSSHTVAARDAAYDVDDRSLGKSVSYDSDDPVPIKRPRRTSSYDSATRYRSECSNRPSYDDIYSEESDGEQPPQFGEVEPVLPQDFRTRPSDGITQIPPNQSPCTASSGTQTALKTKNQKGTSGRRVRITTATAEQGPSAEQTHVSASIVTSTNTEGRDENTVHKASNNRPTFKLESRDTKKSSKVDKKPLQRTLKLFDLGSVLDSCIPKKIKKKKKKSSSKEEVSRGVKVKDQPASLESMKRGKDKKKKGSLKHTPQVKRHTESTLRRKHKSETRSKNPLSKVKSWLDSNRTKPSVSHTSITQVMPDLTCDLTSFKIPKKQNIPDVATTSRDVRLPAAPLNMDVSVPVSCEFPCYEDRATCLQPSDHDSVIFSSDGEPSRGLEVQCSVQSNAEKSDLNVKSSCSHSQSVQAVGASDGSSTFCQYSREHRVDHHTYTAASGAFSAGASDCGIKSHDITSFSTPSVTCQEQNLNEAGASPCRPESSLPTSLTSTKMRALKFLTGISKKYNFYADDVLDDPDIGPRDPMLFDGHQFTFGNGLADVSVFVECDLSEVTNQPLDVFDCALTVLHRQFDSDDEEDTEPEVLLNSVCHKSLHFEHYKSVHKPYGIFSGSPVASLDQGLALRGDELRKVESISAESCFSEAPLRCLSLLPDPVLGSPITKGDSDMDISPVHESPSPSSTMHPLVDNSIVADVHDPEKRSESSGYCEESSSSKHASQESDVGSSQKSVSLLSDDGGSLQSASTVASLSSIPFGDKWKEKLENDLKTFCAENPCQSVANSEFSKDCPMFNPVSMTATSCVNDTELPSQPEGVAVCSMSSSLPVPEQPSKTSSVLEKFHQNTWLPSAKTAELVKRPTLHKGPPTKQSRQYHPYRRPVTSLPDPNKYVVARDLNDLMQNMTSCVYASVVNNSHLAHQLLKITKHPGTGRFSGYTFSRTPLKDNRPMCADELEDHPVSVDQIPNFEERRQRAMLIDESKLPTADLDTSEQLERSLYEKSSQPSEEKEECKVDINMVTMTTSDTGCVNNTNSFSDADSLLRC